jgi:hypothetical protein
MYYGESGQQITKQILLQALNYLGDLLQKKIKGWSWSVVAELLAFFIIIPGK